MTINTAGGVRLFIGSAPAVDPTNLTDMAALAAYEADSYVEVNEVEDAGQYGDESSSITFTSLKDGRVRKLKGPRDAGTMTVVVGTDVGDEGQIAMIAAEKSAFDFNMKIILNDQVTLSGTGTTSYFSAKVMGQRRNVGNVSNVVKTTFNLGINSAIFEVEAD